MTTSRAMDRKKIEEEYKHLKSVYFNSAYFGPSPIRAKATVEKALAIELDQSFYPYNEWMGISDKLRVKMAKLLNTSDDNIMHSTSTSDIVNIVANGFPFQSDDHVAAIDKDYPSNILPWMLQSERGRFVFDRIELGNEIVPTAEWLKTKLHPKTKIFNMSYVTFDTGKKMDILSIGKMLKERGIFFIVDATQALGGMPITEEELKYIDVLACSSYKWMLGPYGHAFAYFSDDAIKKVQHQNANWVLSPTSKSVYDLLNYTTDSLPGARKYDRGQTANILASAALDASYDFLLEVGLTEIEKWNKEVRNHFLENYPKKKYQLVTPIDHMGNIVCVKSISGDSVQLEKELKQRNVDVSVRQGNVRLSFHVFNNQAQVESLIQALDA